MHTFLRLVSHGSLTLFRNQIPIERSRFDIQEETDISTALGQAEHTTFTLSLFLFFFIF